MQSIIVKYLPATDTLPARVKARQSAGPQTLTISSYADDDENVVRRVARELLEKMNKQNGSWRGTWVRAHLDGAQDVWVCVSRDDVRAVCGVIDAARDLLFIDDIKPGE